MTDANVKSSAGETRCPDQETLSAFFDKEKVDGWVEGHVKVCERCGATVAVYGKMAGGMKHGFAAAEPKDFMPRLKAGVREKLAREGVSTSAAPKTINFPYWISSVAAGLAVCALGAYMVTHMETVPPEGQAAPQVASNASVQPSALRSSELSAAPLGSDSSFGAVDLKQLSSVSFGGDDGAKLIAGSVDQQSGAPAVIAPLVKHVWVVPSGADMSSKLDSLAASAGLDKKSFALSSGDNGELSASFSVNRRQAALLVRAFKASGFELLSPAQPQPEQKVFAGTGSEPVDYEASFIFKH